MSEMKTIKFPGDTEPREIVDAKARERLDDLEKQVGNGPDGSTGDLFVVTLDSETNTASHTAAEIMEASQAGKFVTAVYSTGTCAGYLFMTTAKTASFQAYLVGTSIYTNIVHTVDENGSYTSQITSSDFLPASASTDNGKILQVVDGDPEWVTPDSSENVPALISFMDDDCRAATFGTLFPLIQDLGIPLTVACPPGELVETDEDADTYMSIGQLQTMHTNGVEVSCHHLKQVNMNSFASAEAYAADLDACLTKFADMGINDVSTICYPQGVYVDEYMNVVRERFKMGFGVFRGINEVPYESYFMKRCELFPQNGAYTLDDAIKLVNDVAEKGGWLIFMTHAYYPTFNTTAFRDLVAHIETKTNVEIVGVSEAIERTGNRVEVGLFRKPVEDLTEPYFVTDYLGRNYSNGYAAVELSLRTGKLISTTGPVVSVSSGDVEYVVSEKCDISGASSVLVSGWASDGNGLYVFYDDAGNRKAVRYSTKTYAEGGEFLVNEEVAVPDGATQIAIAGHFRQQMPVLKVVKQGSGSGEDGFSPVATVTQTDSGAVISITDENGTTTATVSNGKDGTDGYTPVKGTDYWTDADIAEIKSYVDTAILGGAW